MGISAGMETLSEKSRLERLRSRHRDFYLALADEAEEGLRGPDQKQWRQIVETEYDNFIQALQWSLEIEDGDSALRLATCVYRVLNLRGEPLSATSWLRKSLEISVPPSASRVTALVLLAEALLQQGATEEMMKLREEALEVARASGDRQAEVDALCALGGFANWGLLATSAGGRPKAKQLIQEAVRLAQEIGYERGEAESVWRLSSYLVEEDESAADSLRNHALELYRKLGDMEQVGWLTFDDAWKEVDPTRARQLALEALDIARHLDDPVMLACCFEVLMFLERAGVGDVAAARRWVQQWEEELRAMTPKLQPWQEAWLLEDSASLDIGQGRWHDARRRLERATSLAAKSNYVYQEMHERLSLGSVYLELDGYESALSSVSKALEIVRAAEYLPSLALYQAAIVATAAGDLARAQQMTEEAVELALPSWILDKSFELMTEIALEEGDLAEAEARLSDLLATTLPAFGEQVEPARRDILRAKVARHFGKLDEAQETIASAASELFRLQHRIHFATALEEAGALHQAMGDSAGAGKIIGAAKALRTRIEYPVPQVNRRSYERLLEEVRSSLGEEASGEALKAGAQFTEREVLDLVCEAVPS